MAQPYPETFDHQNGARYTLGWCLCCENDHCHFLKENLCAMYEQRPGICRTYPFFLEDNELKVSRCEGLGQVISEQGVTTIALHLLQRRRAEDEEEQKVRQILAGHQFPPDTRWGGDFLAPAVIENRVGRQPGDLGQVIPHREQKVEKAKSRRHDPSEQAQVARLDHHSVEPLWHPAVPESGSLDRTPIGHEKNSEAGP